MACSNCAIREISPWAPTLSEYETRLQMVDMEVAKLLDGSRLVVELALFGRISPCAALPAGLLRLVLPLRRIAEYPGPRFSTGREHRVQ
jgi:hypothetical protein